MGGTISGGDDGRTIYDHQAIYSQISKDLGGDGSTPYDEIIKKLDKPKKTSTLKKGIAGVVAVTAFALAASYSTIRTRVNADMALQHKVDTTLKQDCNLESLYNQTVTFERVRFPDTKEPETMTIRFPHLPVRNHKKFVVRGEVYKTDGTKDVYSYIPKTCNLN